MFKDSPPPATRDVNRKNPILFTSTFKVYFPRTRHPCPGIANGHAGSVLPLRRPAKSSSSIQKSSIKNHQSSFINPFHPTHTSPPANPFHGRIQSAKHRNPRTGQVRCSLGSGTSATTPRGRTTSRYENVVQGISPFFKTQERTQVLDYIAILDLARPPNSANLSP